MNLSVIGEATWLAKPRDEQFIVIRVLCFSAIYISSIAGGARA